MRLWLNGPASDAFREHEAELKKNDTRFAPLVEANVASAWLLAATEVERLACSACKCERCAEDRGCEVHVRQSLHTTCERALRLARKFRGRAGGDETLPRTRESRVEK